LEDTTAALNATVTERSHGIVLRATFAAEARSAATWG
jgi:hypothetical protein